MAELRGERTKTKSVLTDSNRAFEQCDRSRRSLTIEYAGRTDKGRVRPKNEDAFAFAATGASVPFAVVCDGMGGHLAGEVASKIAVDTVYEQVQAMERIHLGKLRQAIDSANEYIFRYALSHEACKGMGTTIVLAVIDLYEVYILNVGDSRAYYFDSDNHAVEQISRDHSLLEELLSSKQLSPDQADHFPYRHVITRSLGIRQKVKPDLFEINWQKGDAILLCSDGLSDYLNEEDMLHTLGRLGKHLSLAEACADMVELANARGGRDNITVALVRHGGGEGAA